jgi:DNA polymerase-3 subunit chi
MTEITFHVHAPDKVGYACRLLRKAWNQGTQVIVTGDPALLRDLDVSLWTFSALDFVPHCHGATSPMAARTPVVLAEGLEQVPHHDVLVNLGAAVPEGFERFERLIEVVGTEGEDLQLGRARWKHYASRGYALKRHDLAEAAS